MYGCRRNPEFRPLGRFAPVAVDSGLRPETLTLYLQQRPSLDVKALPYPSYPAKREPLALQ